MAEEENIYSDLDDVNTTYHGSISQEEATRRLRHFNTEGGYLIRDSEKQPGFFVLSVLFTGQIFSYRIKRDEKTGTFYMMCEVRLSNAQQREANRFRTLQQLVDHCVDKGRTIGLQCNLSFPCRAAYYSGAHGDANPEVGPPITIEDTPGQPQHIGAPTSAQWLFQSILFKPIDFKLQQLDPETRALLTKLNITDADLADPRKKEGIYKMLRGQGINVRDKITPLGPITEESSSFDKPQFGTFPRTHAQMNPEPVWQPPHQLQPAHWQPTPVNPEHWQSPAGQPMPWHQPYGQPGYGQPGLWNEPQRLPFHGQPADLQPPQHQPGYGQPQEPLQHLFAPMGQPGAYGRQPTPGQGRWPGAAFNQEPYQGQSPQMLLPQRQPDPGAYRQPPYGQPPYRQPRPPLHVPLPVDKNELQGIKPNLRPVKNENRKGVVGDNRMDNELKDAFNRRRKLEDEDPSDGT